MRNLPLKSAAAIAMQVNDTWKLLGRPDMRLKMTTLEFMSSLINELHICPFHFESFVLETFGTYDNELLRPSISSLYWARGGRMIAFQSCSYPYEKFIGEILYRKK